MQGVLLQNQFSKFNTSNLMTYMPFKLMTLIHVWQKLLYDKNRKQLETEKFFHNIVRNISK